MHLLLIPIVGLLQQTDPVAREQRVVLAGLAPAVQIAAEKPERYALGDRMAYYRAPAVAIALIENDRIRWVHVEGRRDASVGTKALRSTPFVVKSLAKPVTALATMRLVDQHRLALDVPLEHYLRSWAIPPSELARDAKPTLRLLLSHSAGFSVRGVPSYKMGEPLPTLVQALQGAPPAKPPGVRIAYVPGERTSYSGGGYSVLQLLLTDQTGETFPALMRRLVLAPVGMHSSDFISSIPDTLKPVLAVGHGNDGTPIAGKWEALVQMAAGGLVTTADDMARFVEELSRAWRGESKLLSRDLAREMLTPNKAGWGLGFEVAGQGDSIRFLHTGSGDGFRALIVGFPARRAGAVILVNSDAAGELRYEILRSLAREYSWPAFGEVTRSTVKVPADSLAALAGRYEFSDASVMEVTTQAAQLFVQWRDLPPQAVYPSTPRAFFNRSNEEFVFSPASSGQPAKLLWRGDFGSFEAIRK
jgi:CubicO group peptidase (beta-lactamase class C family)